MSGKGQLGESKNKRTEQTSLRSSVSDSSLTCQEAEPEASPQSFAALKQAYDFMLPQYKALQTENRSLHKEKEELRKILTEKGTLSLDMTNHSQELPDDLRSRGQTANRTLVVPFSEEPTENSSSENGENCRVSPCGGLDSAINLNDGSSLTIDKSVREERGNWLAFSYQLLRHFPEEKLKELTGIPEHCLEHFEEFVSSIDHQDRDFVLTKLGKLKTVHGITDGNLRMRTSQLVMSEAVGYHMGFINHGEMNRGSPMGKSLPGTSDEEPSDEDIYTSGLPKKRRGRKLIEDDDDDDDHEWVQVDNAVDILEKCASFIHQSLEAHTLLVKKLEENQSSAELSTMSKSYDKIGSFHTGNVPNLPPPPVPNRMNPPVPMSQERPSPKRLDHLRQQLPSTASDPGRASSAMSQLTLEKHFFSDPVVGADPRYNPPKKSRRPRSVAGIPTPLQELSVKYPPLPYGAGGSYMTRSYNDTQIHAPPDFGHQSPITIDHNNFQFEDGQTYQPCGPPEADFRKYEHQEDDDILSWNAARNPDMYQQPPSPVRFPRSDPSKRFVPSSSEGTVRDSHLQRQLPRSSDRIYDMDSPRFEFDTLTTPGYSTGELGRSTLGTQGEKLHIKCPVCEKKFDPGTPDIAINSHVNLHFENEKNHFEIIE